ADRLPHCRDRPFALDDERPGRARGDEVDELAEERLLAMLAVVRLAELAARGQELAGADREAARLDPAENLGGETAPHGVRLDQDQGLLDGHRPRRLPTRRGDGGGARTPASRPRPARLPSRNTGTPARAPRAAACSSCTPA